MISSTFLYPSLSDDAVYLFVVSHPELKTQIEVFRFVEDDLSLLHLRTIKHELLYRYGVLTH